MEKENTSKVFDIIIVGGGVAGVLLAKRLYHLSHQKKKILLLEAKPHLGGRLVLSHFFQKKIEEEYGLIGETLMNYLEHTASLDSQDTSPKNLFHLSQHDFGILSQNELHKKPEVSFLDRQTGAKLISGAGKEWDKISEIFHGATADDAMAQKIWPLPQKHPVSEVLGFISQSVGLDDFWKSEASSLMPRISYVENLDYTGPWSHFFSEFLKENMGESFDCQLGGRVVSGDYKDNVWTLETTLGVIEGTSLVVAHSPWEAIHWLPRPLFPIDILNVVLKTTPTSAVILSQRVPETLELPKYIAVPASEVLIHSYSPGIVRFETVLSYEQTLDAPEVIKALKRLRRAQKKFNEVLKVEAPYQENIMLHPVAWAQSCKFKDKKLRLKLSEVSFNSKVISFCGDAYGSSFNPEENIMESIHKTCEALLQE